MTHIRQPEICRQTGPLRIFLTFIRFSACLCKLIAAGCLFEPACNSGQFFLNLIHGQPIDKRRNRFEISVAASGKRDIRDYVTVDV